MPGGAFYFGVPEMVSSLRSHSKWDRDSESEWNIFCHMIHFFFIYPSYFIFRQSGAHRCRTSGRNVNMTTPIDGTSGP